MTITLAPNPAKPSDVVTLTGTGYPGRKGIRYSYDGWTSPTLRTSRAGNFTGQLVARDRTMPVVVEAYTNRQWAPYGPNAILQVAAPTPVPTPAPTPAPTGITNVTVDATPDSVTIAWDVSPAATGQVQTVSPTDQVKTTPLETTALAHHAQTVTGLAPGLTYRYTITSGGTASGTFTTCWAP